MNMKFNVLLFIIVYIEMFIFIKRFLFLCIKSIDYIFYIDTYEKGLLKLKKAEMLSDINSETDDLEVFKKSRKERAKKTISSSDDNDSDQENRIKNTVISLSKSSTNKKQHILHQIKKM